MRTVMIGALSAVLAAGLAPATSAQQAPSGVRKEFLGQIDDAATKLEQLAEAIPQEKYAWRPGAGVRSVSEVLMHVVVANYYLPTFVGVQSPVSELQRLETSVTAKAEVIAQLKRSFEHMRTTLGAYPDADLDKAASFFGQPTTARDIFLRGVSHAHEHLGQLIAYARANAIVPPWSMAGGN